MDVKKLIQAAEYCKKSNANCYGCPTGLPCVGDREEEILAIRDHVRAEVIAQVREWVENEENIYGDAMGNPVLCKYETLAKLDELAGEERHG